MASGSRTVNAATRLALIGEMVGTTSAAISGALVLMGPQPTAESPLSAPTRNRIRVEKTMRVMPKTMSWTCFSHNLMEVGQMKSKVSAALLLPGLMLTAVPAEAVTLHSQWTASRNNTPGTSTTFTTATFAGQFCFLTTIYMEDTDSVGEGARCRIRPVNGFWRLEATLGPNADDADVNCQSFCYNR